MTKPQKVVWSKGMFLMPQHFQAQDEYVEHALHFRSGVSNFANWGLSRFSLDEASLLNGTVRVRFCEGVFPDGLAFAVDAVDDPPPARQVEPFFGVGMKTLDVYLAIPEARSSARNVSLAAGSGDAQTAAPTRYVVEARSAVDTSIGADEKPIQVGKKALRLLFEGENQDGFSVIRIAQIQRTAAGSYAPNPEFIPPLLDIVASDTLMLLARRQIEILAAKSASLSGPRREKGRDLADFTTSEIASFWLLHTVNSSLPELRHLWQVRRGHPDELFRAMLRLAGALITFALNRSVKDIPDYDHNQLGASFGTLDALIRDLLETVVPSKCIATPLRFVERLTWNAQIADERQLDAGQYLLAVSASLPVDELISKFPRLAKAAAPDEINRLVRNALPGVTMMHMPSPPASVPVHLNNQYFRLLPSDPLWAGVMQARSLSVFVPAEIGMPKMELLTILA